MNTKTKWLAQRGRWLALVLAAVCTLLLPACGANSAPPASGEDPFSEASVVLDKGLDASRFATVMEEQGFSVKSSDNVQIRDADVTLKNLQTALGTGEITFLYAVAKDREDATAYSDWQREEMFGSGDAEIYPVVSTYYSIWFGWNDDLYGAVVLWNDVVLVAQGPALESDRINELFALLDIVELRNAAEDLAGLQPQPFSLP